MKKRKQGHVNRGKLFKKRQHIKATQTKPSMNKRPGRNAMKQYGDKK